MENLPPIFLISYNRSRMLRQAINGIRLQGSYPIIVQDNGSTDPEVHILLKELEEEGVKVHRRPAIHSPDQLINVQQSINEWFSSNPQSDYVVSDCDIDISHFHKDWLRVYRHLLGKYPGLGCVGCMLRVRDVPYSYPARRRMMNRFVEEFWGRKPVIEDLPEGFEMRQVAYLRGRIDTTFALHRKGAPFRRMKTCMRVYAPYEGLHLDWYPNYQSYHNNRVNGISHWGNPQYKAQFKNDTMRYNQYWDVEVYDEDQLRYVRRNTRGIYL